jgi:hypothetical protein
MLFTGKTQIESFVPGNTKKKQTHYIFNYCTTSSRTPQNKTTVKSYSTVCTASQGNCVSDNIKKNTILCQVTELLMQFCIYSTVQPFTKSDYTRCYDNTICPPEDGHVDARNMSRIIM